MKVGVAVDYGMACAVSCIQIVVKIPISSNLASTHILTYLILRRIHMDSFWCHYGHLVTSVIVISLIQIRGF
jgi:hypothetical protein